MDHAPCGDMAPRILFVDDDQDVLDALERRLRPRHAEWHMVFRASPADAVAEQRARPFDVAVTDMRMPGMNGIEVIRKLREICADTICLILTGAADLPTTINAINEVNVFRFYTKPCPPRVLVDGIHEALETGNASRSRVDAAITAFGTMTLDRLPLGVLVVDRRARVLFSNNRGAQFLAGRNGLGMDRAGIVRTSRPAETASLHQLIKAAAADTSHAQSVSRLGDERPLSVLITALSDQAGEGSGPVVLFIGDPDNRVLPTVDIVSRLFELSEAEAKLAVAMAKGMRIEEAAALQGITLSSARTYLKRVFAKTGTEKQAELVGLVLSAPALMESGGPRRG